MKYNILYYAAIAFCISCSSPKNKQVDSSKDRLAELQENQNFLINEMMKISDSKNTWLVDKSCDSMMWSALAGTSLKGYFDYSLAEEDGKFYRTQYKNCYPEDSKSSWSRDMSLALLIYLYSQKDLAAVERHIEYGENNGWIMGEGVKSRTYYTPALISLWYKVAKTLGHDYRKFIIPNVYTKGLIDYQAHLQMLDIYLNGELDGAISDGMLSRVREHSSRLPSSNFYDAIRSKYLGDFSRVIGRCISDEHLVGDYVRCDNEPCELAEQIFACGIITKFMDKKGK